MLTVKSKLSKHSKLSLKIHLNIVFEMILDLLHHNIISVMPQIYIANFIFYNVPRYIVLIIIIESEKPVKDTEYRILY